MEDNILKEKSRADGAVETLENLRGYVADYLSVPQIGKQRSEEEQQFWEELATSSLIERSNVPGWWGTAPGEGELPAKIVLPVFSGG